MWIKILFYSLLLISYSFAQVKQFVNPFTGTSNGGNTFPGAVVPWGMISISPHNSPGSPSGYIYEGKYFYGFGLNHLSGTGCADLGSVVITIVKQDTLIDPEKYKTAYSNEYAEPGYYSLYLDDLKIKGEVTAAARSGLLKFTPDSQMSANILIDAGRSLNLTGGGSVRIVSDSEIEGSNISGGFCGEDNRQTTYFAAKFSRPFLESQIRSGSNLIIGQEYSVKDSSIVCLLKFLLKPGEPLVIKTGISYVSRANARENMEKEIPAPDFELVKKSAGELWEENLSRIKVEGSIEADKIKFYTALYHMLLNPNIINDVNGEYPLMGRKDNGKYTNRNRYTVFSLWDTYRTLHPFLTLVYPERQSEMIKTMLDMYDENGYLPKWELAGNETFMMVGDPAVPVIADSYIKGVSDFNFNKALEAALKPVLLKENEHAPPVRAGYHQLLKYKYIPFEQDFDDDWWVWGPVSTTLEYCFADWTISQLAKRSGNEDLYNEFLTRSHYYKNLFDESSLFIRPKLKNGKWISPFDSLALEGSGYWQGSGGPGYVEGNAWNYTWFVPHDIEGLIDLFGSEEIFSERLLRAFEENHFTINNEPDISYPYLFTYIKGKEYLTKEIVSKIIESSFGTGPDGLPGNDDCGTISGWFVFSALGFYPVTPASDNYRAGVPLFDRVILKLNNSYYKGEDVIIEKGARNSGRIFFNNEQIEDYMIIHDELVKGGKLVFE